jgi:argininosuccinate lyase
MMGSTTAADGTKVFNVRVKAEAMKSALRQGYATATDLADWLVKRGLPFRDAHEAVARAVRLAEQKGCDVSDLTLDELKSFSPLVDESVFAVLTVEGSLSARNHIGGTAPEQVRAAIGRARARLATG